MKKKCLVALLFLVALGLLWCGAAMADTVYTVTPDPGEGTNQLGSPVSYSTGFIFYTSHRDCRNPRGCRWHPGRASRP